MSEADFKRLVLELLDVAEAFNRAPNGSRKEQLRQDIKDLKARVRREASNFYQSGLDLDMTETERTI